MQARPIIETKHLFTILDDKLIELLSSLTAEEWNRPTIAKLWTVKDIVAHLLDTNIRGISILRDGYLNVPPSNIQSYQELINYLNTLNADWVNAMKRASPQALIALHQSTSKDYIAAVTALPPFEKAVFGVAWAGEEESYNWFHVAREYTEKFIHQQQIRKAVGKEGILTKELFYPFIDTFMQGMPYTFSNTVAAEGTVVKITVTTEIGGHWFVERTNNAWQLTASSNNPIAAHVSIDPDTAWKLFSKGITPQQAYTQTTIVGNETLAKTALGLVAVMA